MIKPPWWRDGWTWFVAACVVYLTYAATLTRSQRRGVAEIFKHVAGLAGGFAALLLAVVLLTAFVAPFFRDVIWRRQAEGRTGWMDRVVDALANPWFAAVALILSFCLLAFPHDFASGIALAQRPID